MADEKQVRVLRQGKDTWNQWRSRHRLASPEFVGARLEGLNLSKANLRKADFKLAQLQKANLKGADFSGADFSEADLTEANLEEADLSEVDFSRANLTEANLVGSDLRRALLDRVNLALANLTQSNLNRAYFREANLTGADFSDCVMGFTVFGQVDLRTVKGLETVRHTGPSSIGLDTIYLSGGTIPKAFLRGAGVLDGVIDFTMSLTSKALSFHSCFISYSSKDQEFAERLHNDLQAQGVRCWFAPHDVQGGKKLYEQIDYAIRIHEKLLLILSRDSMNSEWVKTEIAKARNREMEEKKRVLFPIRLVDFDLIRKWECFDADAGKDSAREVREYFIPDFSNWTDPPSYRAAFERLLKDLRGEGSKRIAAS